MQDNWWHYKAAIARGRLSNTDDMAVVGVLSTLMGEGDVIFSDALNHASLIDGCRLSRARVDVFPHRDLGALEALLSSTGERGRRRIIVHPRCERVIEELTLYAYKTDDRTGEILPVLEDKNNHTIDALRYALEALRRVPKKPEPVPSRNPPDLWGRKRYTGESYKTI